MMSEIDEVLAENRRRNEALAVEYDPIEGVGCIGERCRVAKSAFNDGDCYVPVAMTRDRRYVAVSSRDEWVKLRCEYDFEFWCATCVMIQDKLTGRDRRLVLNVPQRRVAAILESDRVAQRPMRLIMLKARQWGGSTLVQIYAAWMQCVHCRNWHSLICAHVKDTAANIRGMYSKVLSNYPENYWTGDEAPKFRPYERSVNIREIAGRNCRVTIGSSENQEAVRGSDYAMAHLSEVAFWHDSQRRSPDGFIRAVCGGIALAPNTLIVLESTANGVGNYFHSEWLRSKAGQSDKHAVMVPWYEIEIYRQRVTDAAKLWREMDDYERNLWNMGLTLEMIQWYHLKRREYPSHSMMKAEYPTDDVEAFVNTGAGVFDAEHVERLRRDCCEPKHIGELMADSHRGEGALRNIRFSEDSCGKLKVWAQPQEQGDRFIENRYVVSVDIGGRAESSDYSVITVVDRNPLIDARPMEIVAQWRGHIDHDLLAWKSAMIAKWYNDALLVIESNTLETECTEGDHGLFILDQLRDVYNNMYYRETFDKSGMDSSYRIGFHTNRATKRLVIDSLIGMVREGAYKERAAEACDELMTFEQKENGSCGAKAGYHDDVVMSRAIGLYVAASQTVYVVNRPRRVKHTA
ncbi:MAG: hypothetical protein IKZ14_06900 [Muribaculaceae bacterium]|nr:hypothetical protein [Muribaculaceae bacterium]